MNDFRQKNDINIYASIVYKISLQKTFIIINILIFWSFFLIINQYFDVLSINKITKSIDLIIKKAFFSVRFRTFGWWLASGCASFYR